MSSLVRLESKIIFNIPLAIPPARPGVGQIKQRNWAGLLKNSPKVGEDPLTFHASETPPWRSFLNWVRKVYCRR
jgi:hypothetical protein